MLLFCPVSVAIQDLTKALELCESKGETAKNAFCQRGLLFRKTDEDAAREDFKMAAGLGSAFARNQVRMEMDYLRGKLWPELSISVSSWLS